MNRRQPSHLVVIAGGSGAGKSTVAALLTQRYQDRISLLHLDDYFRPRVDVPVIAGMTNWDHPDAIDWNRLRDDLDHLFAGLTVKIQTKHSANGRTMLPKKLERSIRPKQVIILEGFLALTQPTVRDRASQRIYLDGPIELRLARRTVKLTALPTGYLDRVYRPMHQQFVEPTKRFADDIIDVQDRTAVEVAARVESLLGHFHLSSGIGEVETSVS